MEYNERLLRFISVDIIGSHCSEMQGILRLNVTIVNTLKIFQVRNDMPLTSIFEVKLFDVWGIDFMGPFPPVMQPQLHLGICGLRV